MPTESRRRTKKAQVWRLNADTANWFEAIVLHRLGAVVTVDLVSHIVYGLSDYGRTMCGNEVRLG